MTESRRLDLLRRDALLIGVLHVAVAAWYWLGRGVTIVHDYGPDPWSWFWQNIPTDLLRDHPIQSLWFLHAQPPLWNALGAVMLALFDGAQLPALQALHILLGAATAALCYVLAARITGSRGWGIAAGSLVALHPALLLYEAYALYTTLVAFLVVLAAWLLLEAAERSSPWRAVGFVAVLVALVLTRSLFHVVVLLVMVPLAVLAGGRPNRKQAWTLALLVLLPLGWYGKNLAQYGFFGGSSWYGMGLWRTALFRQDQEPLQAFFHEGLLDPVVELAPYSPPSEYRRLGYTATSPIPLLNRDDFHNINVPAISAAYQRSAVALIRRTPARYLENVLVGYGNFSAPSTDFTHLSPNRNRIRVHAQVYRWLVGRPLMQAVEGPTGFYFGSLYFFLIPLTLGIWVVLAVGGVRSRAELFRRLRADAACAYITLMVAYTALAGCAMELGENVRFKFLVEPAFLVLFLVVVRRFVLSRSRS